LNCAMVLLATQLQADGVTVVMFHPGGVQVESFGSVVIPGLEPADVVVGKLIRTIDGLTFHDSGRFLNNDGTDHPW